MPVRSAVRALDLIELLAQHTRPIGLAELYRATGLPKSSTLLLLRTLEARRYVVREAEGYRLVRLPGEVPAGSHGERLAWGTLVRLATPALTEAAAATNESAFLAVLTGASRVRYLCKMLPFRQEMKYDRNIDVDRIPHHVASGLALLAGLSDAAAEAYVSGIEAGDPVPRDAARHAIETVRRSGVAVNMAGRVEGAAGVAVTVRDSSAHAVAAVNLAGPAARVRAGLPALTQAAREAASRIGNELARFAPRVAAGPAR